MCEHQGCVVSSVANGKIVCQCHNSQYNIADGSVAQGPATKGLPAKTVSVSGDSLIVSHAAGGGQCDRETPGQAVLAVGRLAHRLVGGGGRESRPCRDGHGTAGPTGPC